MFKRTQLIRTAFVVVTLIMFATCLYAQTAVAPAVSKPAVGLLDGKTFTGKLTLKTTTVTSASATPGDIIVIDDGIAFKEGKIYSQAFTAKGYQEACPYIAKKETKGISFTVNCAKIDDPKNVMVWTGLVTPATATAPSMLKGTVKMMQAEVSAAEYTIDAKDKAAEEPQIELQGVFGKTEKGCFFIETEEGNIALQMPLTFAPIDKFGQKIHVKGVWSMTDEMHCEMSKMLIVSTFEFSDSNLPTYGEDQ